MTRTLMDPLTVLALGINDDKVNAIRLDCIPVQDSAAIVLLLLQPSQQQSGLTVDATATKTRAA